MRRGRRWLIGAAVLAAVAGGGVAFYRTFVDTTYARAEFYPDTGLAPALGQPGFCLFPERDGHVTLVVARGEPHGIVTTYHGWTERLAVEVSTPAAGGRVEVGGPGTQVYLCAVMDGRIVVTFGAGGVRGWVQIEEVEDRRITASYDIVVDGYAERLLPEYRKREVVFRGRDVFRRRPRPAAAQFGDLWPRQAPRPRLGGPLPGDGAPPN